MKSGFFNHREHKEHREKSATAHEREANKLTVSRY